MTSSRTRTTTASTVVAKVKFTDCTATAEWDGSQFWIGRGPLPLQPPEPGSFWFELEVFSRRLGLGAIPCAAAW